VRELENLLHRAVALSDGQSLSLDDDLDAGSAPVLVVSSQPVASLATPSAPSPSTGLLPSDLQAHLDEQEKQILVKALKDTGFNRTAAAARLGMSLRQIRYRMARLGIEADDGKN
jgi:two-component system, NtrC family, response regulator PilR